MSDSDNQVNPEAAKDTRPENADVTHLTAAQVVKAAREQMGLTQKEVADQLFLTTSFIRYIDEGEYERIPKPAFTKGYLRSYARVVGLDGDALVGLYESDVAAPEENTEIRDVTQETVGSSNFTGPVFQTGVAALIAVIALIGLVWWFASSDDEPVPVVTMPDDAYSLDSQLSEGALVSNSEAVSESSLAPATASAVEGRQPASGQAVPSSNAQTLSETAAVQGTNAGVVTTEAESTLAAANVAASAAADVANVNNDQLLQDGQLEDAVAADNQSEDSMQSQPEQGNEVAAEQVPAVDVNLTRVVDGDVRYITLDAGGFDEVEIRFNDECWVEIRNADGASLYGDLNRSGDIMRVLADTPLKLLFGRAAAVSLTLNGEEVDLAPHTTREATARLTLTP